MAAAVRCGQSDWEDPLFKDTVELVNIKDSSALVAIKEILESSLPEGCVVFFGVDSFGYRYDCIVIGPSGVILVRPVDATGKIVYKDGKWYHVNGKSMFGLNRKKMENHTESLHDAYRRLKSFFLENHIHVRVLTALAFTDREVRFSLDFMEHIKIIRHNNAHDFFNKLKRSPLKDNFINKLNIAMFKFLLQNPRRE